jgi:hypothetical protein
VVAEDSELPQSPLDIIVLAGFRKLYGVKPTDLLRMLGPD